jgi:hypothetical protein
MGHWSLMIVIQAIQEPEIRRIMDPGQPWPKRNQDPIIKLPNTKKGLVVLLKKILKN